MLPLALFGIVLLGLSLAAGSKAAPGGELPPGAPPSPDPATAAKAVTDAIVKSSPVAIPEGVQKAIAQALSSKNVAQMTAVANSLAKQYPYAAQQLKAAAAAIARQTMTGTPATSAPSVGPSAKDDATIRAQIQTATDPVALDNLGNTLAAKPGYGTLAQLAYGRAKELRAMLATANAVQKTQAVLTTAAPAVTAASQPLLMRGSTGEAVKTWQRIVGVTPDGVFGSGTEAATKRWQSAHGIYADGKVGPKTWAAATAAQASAAPSLAPPVLQASPVSAPASVPSSQPLLVRGSTGEAVKAWQRIIGVTPDGIFGSGTEAATKRWQSAHGLYADGKVGPNTWTAASAQAPSLQAAPLSVPPPPSINVPAMQAPVTTPLTDLQVKTMATAQYIKGARRGSEDKMMIKNWQTMAGLPSPDGLFGAGSAERMAELGVSDLPMVWYWPKTNATARVATYKSRLNEMASQAEAAGDTNRATLLRASAARDNGQGRQIGE